MKNAARLSSSLPLALLASLSLAVACSDDSSLNKADPNLGGSSGSAGTASNVGGSSSQQGGTSSSSGGSENQAGSAGSVNLAGSGGTGSGGSTGGSHQGGAGGSSSACVGNVSEAPSAGLESPLWIVATSQAILAFEYDELLGGKTALRSFDGVTFAPLGSDLPAPVRSVAATANHVYFATWDKLFESDSTMSSWQEVPLPENTWSVGEIRTNGNRAIVSLGTGNAIASEGDGVWESLGDTAVDPLAGVLFASYDGDLAVGASNCTGGIVTRKGSAPWVLVESLPQWGYNDVLFLPSGKVLATRFNGVGSFGEISLARLDTGSDTWESLPNVVETGGLTRLYVSNEGIVGVGPQGVFLSVDEGESWSLLPGAAGDPTSAAVFGDSIIVGRKNGIQVGTATGLETKDIRSATIDRIEQLVAGPVVQNKTQWLSFDSGLGRYSPLLDAQVLDLRQDAKGHVTALKPGHKVALSDDGGQTWIEKSLSAQLNGEFITLAGVASGHTFISSIPWQGASSCSGNQAPTTLNSIGIMRRSSTGQTQSAVDGLPVTQVVCTTGEKRYPQITQVLDAPGGMIAVSVGYGAFFSQDEGLSWVTLEGTEKVTSATVSSDHVYLSTGESVLISTVDSQHFQEMLLPQGVKINALGMWGKTLALATEGAESAVLLLSNDGFTAVQGLEGKTGTSLGQSSDSLLVGVKGQALYKIDSCSALLDWLQNPREGTRLAVVQGLKRPKGISSDCL